MDNQEQACEKEKWSGRTVGLIILPFSLILAFIGALIVPVLGLFFAVPLLVLALGLIFAPESKVCRMILRKEANPNIS